MSSKCFRLAVMCDLFPYSDLINRTMWDGYQLLINYACFMALFVAATSRVLLRYLASISRARSFLPRPYLPFKTPVDIRDWEKTVDEETAHSI